MLRTTFKIVISLYLYPNISLYLESREAYARPIILADATKRLYIYKIRGNLISLLGLTA